MRSTEAAPSPLRQKVVRLLASCVVAVLAGANPARSAPTATEAGIAAYRRGDFPVAQGLLLPAATRGDAQAELLMGNMAALRADSEPAAREEVRWYRLAADQGLATAQARLAACYATGSGVAQSDAEALKWYLLAAAQGDVQAAASLAYLYQFGSDVPQDYQEAAHWYRVAGEYGDALSQNMLGDFYASGVGVGRSATDSTAWYRLAADQGDPTGQYHLAVAYEEGLGVERDPVTAYAWVSLALENLVERDQKDAAIRLIGAISAHMSKDQVAAATRRASAWRPAAGTARDYWAPDGTLRAQVVVAGPGGESHVTIRERDGVLVAASYASSDGRHGFVVRHADWTADSRFFVFSLASSGGHQPWHNPIQVYSRRRNLLAALDEPSGSSFEPDFELSAPDFIQLRVDRMGAPPIELRLELGKIPGERH